MSQTNNKPSGNGLIELGASPASHLDPGEFMPVEWQFDVQAARLMAVPFRVYFGGRWHDGAVGDWIIFGALGEVAIVAGSHFPQLCRLQSPVAKG